MAENSLIRDLLKTPEQLRAERFDRLREGARARAQLMGGGPATTALPGLLTGLAQQSMVAQAPMAEQMRQRGLLGLSSIAGAIPSTTARVDGTAIPIDVRSMTTGTPRDITTQVPDGRNQELSRELAVASMTPEERVQAQTRGILQAGGTKKPEELLKLAEQLRAAGRFDLAETFETRAKGLADTAKGQAAIKAVGDSLVREAATVDDPVIKERLMQINALLVGGKIEADKALEMAEQLREGTELDTTAPTKVELALVSGTIKASPSLQKMVDSMSSTEGWFFDSVDEEIAASVEGAIAWRSRQILDKGKGKVTPQQAVEQATKELFEEHQKKQKSKQPKNNPALKKQDVLPEDEARERAVEGATA